MLCELFIAEHLFLNVENAKEVKLKDGKVYLTFKAGFRAGDRNILDAKITPGGKVGLYVEEDGKKLYYEEEPLSDCQKLISIEKNKEGDIVFCMRPDAFFDDELAEIIKGQPIEEIKKLGPTKLERIKKRLIDKFIFSYFSDSQENAGNVKELMRIFSPTEFTLNEKKRIIRKLSHEVFINNADAALLKEAVDFFATNNNERDKLLNEIKKGKKRIIGQYRRDFKNYAGDFEYFLSPSYLKIESKILLNFVSLFPELKEWLKQQFDLNMIKKLVETLYKESKSENKENIKKEIKEAMRNLIATFDIDEYFLRLFA